MQVVVVLKVMLAVVEVVIVVVVVLVVAVVVVAARVHYVSQNTISYAMCPVTQFTSEFAAMDFTVYR